MSSHYAPLATLLEQLRRLVLVYSGVDFTDAMPLIRQALAFLSLGEMDGPDTAGFSSDLAYLTADMLENSHHAGFIKSSLEVLFKLGFLGESLAVSFALKKTMAPEHFLAVLTSLTPEEQLLFANALLRTRRTDVPELLKWALALVERIENDDPEEALVLLEHLSNRKDKPALVVVNELLGGRLGIWLQQLLKMDLSEEQAAYMATVAGPLESAGLTHLLAQRSSDSGAATLSAICDAAGRSGGPDAPAVAKKLLRYLEHPDDGVKLAAIRALASLHEARAADAAAPLYEKRPDLRPELVPIIASLSLPAFQRFLKTLAKTERAEALLTFFAVFATAAPGQTWRMLEAIVKNEGAGKTGTAGDAVFLKKLIRTCAANAPKELQAPHPRRKSPYKAFSDEDAEKLIDKIRRVVGLDESKSRKHAAKMNLLKAITPGAAFRKRTLSHMSFSNTDFSKTTFTGCAIKNLEAQACTFSGTVFHACRFERVNFTGSRFEKTMFEDCRFNHCLFHGTRLNETFFQGCEALGTHFSDAAGKSPRFELCRFSECDFFGFRASEADFSCCGFETVNFSHTALESARFYGADFRDCCFEKTFIAKSDIRNARTSGCFFLDCRFRGLNTDEPIFMSVFAASRRDVQGHAARSAPRENVSPAGALRLAAKVTETWFSLENADRRLRRILANNARRLAWAGFKLGEQGADFLTMLPGLIEAGKTMGATGLVSCLPAKIKEYRPSLESAHMLGHILAEPPVCGLVAPGNYAPQPIEAVYAMGSLGAIAQTRRSDLDVWVCYRKKDADPKAVDRFRLKLDAIAAYAADSFGLEIHFFLMTVEDIRDNNFGFSDEESCGSTQAMLLKEEFYRTALVLAGKKPSWWIAPAGVSRAGYDAALARLAAHLPETAEQFADLGHLGRLGEIAGPEYFGASLWLIVKSLKSPFKSVMKIALLEKYLRGQGARTLLCDRIKENLFQGKRSLWDTDPYALLFSDVNGYFAEREDAEAMELMRAAFIQKTGVDPVERVPLPGEEFHGGRGMELFFPMRQSLSVNIPAAEAMQEDKSQGDGVFSELVASGYRFAGFLSRTYESLMASRGVSGETQAISERDLTMLGRKISSRFRKRKHKIMRLPFVSTPKDLFSALEILFDDKAKEPSWAALGELRGRRIKNASEEIRREPCLERLAAWLAANDIHSPGVYLKGGAAAAPISFPDIQDLFAAIHEAFPLRDTFEPPIMEYLNPERVMAALLVVNLRIPREERRIAEVSAIYATNWGEMFFQEKMGGLQLLENKPFDFLRFNIPIEIDPLPRIETYTPAKAQCPKMVLSFYS